MIRSGIIEEKNREIYYFGMRQGLFYTLNLLTFMAISLLLGDIWELGVFLLVYIILRRYVGGYHAETKLGCYVLSTAMIGIVGFVLKFIHFNLSLIVIMLSAAGVTIWIVGPVEDHHKPLDDLEIKIYSKRMSVYLQFAFIMTGIAIALNKQVIMESATLAITFVGIMAVLGLIKNKMIGTHKERHILDK